MTADSKTIRFRKGNKVLYWQDFRYKRGLPSGVDFMVRRVGHGNRSFYFTLTGIGYGVLHAQPSAYGCGSIHIYATMPSMRKFRRTVARIAAAVTK